MKEIRLNDQWGHNYKRITKQNAIKAFNEGLEIIIAPCKMNPFSMYGIGARMQKDKSYINSFEKFTTAFIYSNCSYAVGNYISYYIEER